MKLYLPTLWFVSLLFLHIVSHELDGKLCERDYAFVIFGTQQRFAQSFTPYSVDV